MTAWASAPYASASVSACLAIAFGTMADINGTAFWPTLWVATLNGGQFVRKWKLGWAF